MFSAATITVSDRSSRGEREDLGGPELVRNIEAAGGRVIETHIIPDDVNQIEALLRTLADKVDVVALTGGTGVSQRDVTPEAAERVIDRPLPGFGEIMRTATYSKTPLSIISRGGAGVAGRCLIVTLPGSPKAIGECFELIAPAVRHTVKILADRAGDDDHRIDANN
jgi:molybdenum cofactor synthesis domain-containing protein